MEKQCQQCGSDWRDLDSPIDPKYFIHKEDHDEQIERFGRCYCLPYGDIPEGERFCSRLIGVEIRGIYDGILYWVCPDCGYSWPRSGLSESLTQVALECIEESKNQQ